MVDECWGCLLLRGMCANFVQDRSTNLALVFPLARHIYLIVDSRAVMSGHERPDKSSDGGDIGLVVGGRVRLPANSSFHHALISFFYSTGWYI
jgi:hypothetical protein